MTPTVSTPTRRHHPIALLDAARQSPVLAGLASRMQASSERLQAIRPLLPAPLRAAVQAGPMDEGQWCLLVHSNAVAAKLRQLLPTLQQQLITRNLPVTGIRIKVLGHPR